MVAQEMMQREFKVHLRLWSNEYDISPSSLQHSYSVNVGFVSPVAMLCSVLLDAALRSLMAIRIVGKAIEHFFCSRFCCALLKGGFPLIENFPRTGTKRKIFLS